MILETTRESLSMAMDAQVTKAHSREQRWNAEYAALRELCLGTGLHESLKWGQACYDLENRNVVLIHGFKAYCALLFMKGVLLKDPHGVLVQQTKNVQAARQMRFGSLADIQRQRREGRGSGRSRRGRWRRRSERPDRSSAERGESFRWRLAPRRV